ncbi:hypothetical protein C8Q78DRAFT_1080037 [Trametes maxima]|nr:hypothetical protein C8Q78DRAFT_1080037 [Trametes maxima]
MARLDSLSPLQRARPHEQYIPQPPSPSPPSPPALPCPASFSALAQPALLAPHQNSLSAPTPRPPPAMTVMTAVAAPMPSPFNPVASRPRVSSPLAASAQPRPVPSRQHSFPTSRPLRPFPSIAASSTPQKSARKPVKLIEPPANFKGAFVLNLTQAELSRQD